MDSGQQQEPQIPPAKKAQPVRESAAVEALWHNMITLFGLVVVAVSICLLLTFGLFSLIAPSANPYLGIIGYLVLPGMLVFGLIVCPVGMLITRWRRRAGTRRLVLGVRSAGIFMGVSFFLVLPMVGVTAYEGYHYTESVDFCANVCHSVMEPQGSTFSRSPHARVSCAECHIGAGASPFVKSKLSGVRQVFAVLGDTYPRPIPPAITELRPARETCEECHWPQKFFGDQLMTVVHYSPDESNSRHEVNILLKTGGADETLGIQEGIHMHMLGDIEFVATDDLLQNIPWVRYVDSEGAVRIFRSDGRTELDPPAGKRRRVDCMDCHNRGAHKFTSPQESVNRSLEVGQLDASLPYIKREAVRVLSAEYKRKDEALARIERQLLDFYNSNYDTIMSKDEDRAKVEHAISVVQGIYERSFFPHMNVSWRTYPSNIGHLTSPGCLRCHDGRHVDAEGVAISSDCDVCHRFLNRDPETSALHEGTFDHSMRIHDRWEGFGPHKDLRCDQCHSGGPLPLCADCHSSGAWLEQQGQGKFREHVRDQQ